MFIREQSAPLLNKRFCSVYIGRNTKAAFSVGAAEAGPGVLMACQRLSTLTRAPRRRTGVLLSHTHIQRGTLGCPQALPAHPLRATFTLGKGKAGSFGFLDHHSPGVELQVQRQVCLGDRKRTQAKYTSNIHESAVKQAGRCTGVTPADAAT